MALLKFFICGMVSTHPSFSIAVPFTASDRDFNWIQQGWVYFFNTRQAEGVQNNILVITLPYFLTIINLPFDSLIFCLRLDGKEVLELTNIDRKLGAVESVIVGFFWTQHWNYLLSRQKWLCQKICEWCSQVTERYFNLPSVEDQKKSADVGRNLCKRKPCLVDLTV